MPQSNLVAMLAGEPQVLEGVGARTFTPGTVREPPLTPAPVGPRATIYRNGALPNPLVGGIAERGDYAGRTLDYGFSPHNRAPFYGQGSLNTMPPESVPVGSGTPSVRAQSILAGFTAQQTTQQPVSALSGAATYVAALAPTVED